MHKLVELTDSVINEVIKNEVVLPSQYKETFEAKAKEFNINIEDEQKLIEEMVEKELNKANNLMQHTRSQANRLEAYTNDASKAIKANDTAKLDAIASDVNKLKREIQRLQMSTYMDPLTKTYNRAWLSENFLHNDTFTDDGTLVFIDLNKFKVINDTYGHLVGDKILIFVSNFLKQKFKGSKIVRFGGDEFILFTTEDTQSVKEQLAKDLKELEAKKLKAPNGDLLFVSFAYGVIAYKKDDIFRDALEIADTLMYKNKEAAHIQRES